MEEREKSLGVTRIKGIALQAAKSMEFQVSNVVYEYKDYRDCFRLDPQGLVFRIPREIVDDYQTSHPDKILGFAIEECIIAWNDGHKNTFVINYNFGGNDELVIKSGAEEILRKKASEIIALM